jgi:hypothetical protein
MMGALMENGPYRLQEDGKTLKDNVDGTWNLDANLVRIESISYGQIFPFEMKCPFERFFFFLVETAPLTQ